jgi:aflatoxin B1 aldehyde reductase
MHHSPLEEGDGVIIGASKCAHFESNLEALSHGPLPDSVVAACDEAWSTCESVCPAFARGYAGSDL